MQNIKNLLSELKSGSDIRGVAIEHEGKTPNLTTESIKFIAKYFIVYISEKLKKDAKDLKISIGNDPRITTKDLKSIFIKELIQEGIFVYDFGISTTPAMFMSTIFEEYNCDAAIMFTASHLPFYYNGMKFFTRDGGFEKEDISKMIEGAIILSDNPKENPEINKKEINPEKSAESKKLVESSILKEYSSFLVNNIRKSVNSKSNYEKPLKGLHIVVDAGNGSGGFFAKDVLEVLGANTSGSSFLEPDGYFPNHIPNPEDEIAMNFLKNSVLENKADFGIIFDTDVDRASCVDKNGEEINRNKLIALSSAIILEEHPSTTIVTDSITSTGLNDFITALGGKHFRFKRGYKNVINKAIDLNKNNEECHLAIETSGHAAFKENFFLDDGAYLISKILIKLAKLKEINENIEDILKNYREASESNEIRLKVDTKNIKEYTDKIIEDLYKFSKKELSWEPVEENYEGIRVNCSFNPEKNELNLENSKLNTDIKYNSWFLLRASLHEPIICINLESDILGGVAYMKEKLLTFLKNYKDIKFN